MLIVNQLSGFGGHAINDSLHDILLDLGLTTNLEICLDAGSAASYTSGQKWLDLTANGVDFYRGADGSAASDDPTFNGSAGALSSSEYWSFDGADFFRYDTSNETWMQNIHKNNAAFTFVGLIYAPSSASVTQGVFGNSTSTATNVGFTWRWTASDGRMNLVICKGSTGYAMVGASTGGLNTDAWNFIAISVDEAAGGSNSFVKINGTVDTFDGAYTSPSASNATYTTEIGATGNGIAPLENTVRIAAWAALSEALSQSNVESIRSNIRGRFGI